MPRLVVLVALAALVRHGAAFAPPQLTPALRRRPAAAGVSAAAKKKQPAVAFKGFGAVPPKLESRVPGAAPHGSDRARTAARYLRCATAASRLTASAPQSPTTSRASASRGSRTGSAASPSTRAKSGRRPRCSSCAAGVPPHPRPRSGVPSAAAPCARVGTSFPELACVGRWPAGTPAMPIGYQTGSSTRRTGCALHCQHPRTPARRKKSACHRAPCVRTWRSLNALCPLCFNSHLSLSLSLSLTHTHTHSHTLTFAPVPAPVCAQSNSDWKSARNKWFNELLGFCDGFNFNGLDIVEDKVSVLFFCFCSVPGSGAGVSTV